MLYEHVPSSYGAWCKESEDQNQIQSVIVMQTKMLVPNAHMPIMLWEDDYWIGGDSISFGSLREFHNFDVILDHLKL